MEKFCLEKNGAVVRFLSDVPLKEYYQKNYKKMEFFDAKVISDNSDIEHCVIYKNLNSSSPLLLKQNEMHINYPFEKLNESILLYMGYHFFEKQFGEKGMCSCHSACVEKNGNATLLIGEAGAGKTSLAINLCKNYDFSLISNDLTLIGLDSDNKLKTFGGTKFINLRLDSVNQNMPYLSYLFSDGIKDSWSDKVSVCANEIGIQEQYNICEIKNILYVHTDNRIKNILIKPGDSWRNNFLLYQNLSSHIRGQAATFIDKNGHPISYIPSFDTNQIYDNRMKIIKYIDDSPNYYSVNGNLKCILNFIVSLYNDSGKYIDLSDGGKNAEKRYYNKR